MDSCACLEQPQLPELGQAKPVIKSMLASLQALVSRHWNLAPKKFLALPGMLRVADSITFKKRVCYRVLIDNWNFGAIRNEDPFYTTSSIIQGWWL